MNQYEALYIIDVALDEETNRSVIEKFKGIVEANGGASSGQSLWGWWL